MCFIFSTASELERISEVREAAIRFWLVAVSDGFDTAADEVLLKSFPKLSSRLPAETCVFVYLWEPDEVRDFKSRHSLYGRVGPLLSVSDSNPFRDETKQRSAIVELGRLSDVDEVKKVLVAVTDQAHDEAFVREARNGEVLRRIEQSLGKFGGPVLECLSILGFA